MKTYIILSLILVFLANAKVQTEAAYGVEPIETLNTSYINTKGDSQNTIVNSTNVNQPEKENKSDIDVTNNNTTLFTTPTPSVVENSQSNDVKIYTNISPEPTPTIIFEINTKETIHPEIIKNDTCGIGYELSVGDSESSTKPTLECFKI